MHAQAFIIVIELDFLGAAGRQFQEKVRNWNAWLSDKGFCHTPQQLMAT